MIVVQLIRQVYRLFDKSQKGTSTMKTKPIANQLHEEHNFFPRAVPAAAARRFTLIELLVVIAIIAIVVASKTGFFLQFSAIFAFKAL